MARNFNPSTPDIAGMEWLPASARVLTLDSPKKALVQRFKSPGATTVTAVHNYLRTVVDQSSNLAFCTEIVDTLTPTVTTNTFRPSIDVTTVPTGLAVATARSLAGSTNALWSTVEEATIDTSDGITRSTTSVPWAVGFRTTIANGSLSGKRIVAVRVKCVAQSTAAAAKQRGSYITPGLYDGTSFYPGAETFLAAQTNAPRTTISFAWDVNPATGLPWEPHQVELLKNTSGTLAMYFQNKPVNGGLAKILQAWLEVDTVTDNRKGYKYGNGPQAGWNSFTLTSTSALASNTYYYLVSWCPRPTTSRYATIPVLADPECRVASSATSANSLEHRHVYDVAVRNGSGVLTGSASYLTRSEIAPFLLETAAGISSVSQPYVALTSVSVNADGPTGFGQEITSSGSQSYAGATFVAGWESAHSPDGPLTVTFVEGAGTGAGTVRATGVHRAPKATTDAQKAKPARVRVPFLAAYLAGGFTQYSLRFTSTAKAGRGWKLLVLDTGTDRVTTTTSASVESVGWGSQSDAYFTGLTRNTRYDMPANITSGSNPPGSFTATASAAS